MQPAQLSAAVPTVLYQMVHFPASLTVRKFVDPLPQTEEEWVFHGVLCRDPIATFELQQLGKEVSPIAVKSTARTRKPALN